MSRTVRKGDPFGFVTEDRDKRPYPSGYRKAIKRLRAHAARRRWSGSRKGKHVGYILGYD